MGVCSRLASLVALVLERPAAIRAIATWPSFSITSYRMLDDLRRQGVCPATVIDVGANVGQFGCAALRLLRPKRLHAFEPLPDAVAILRRRLGAEPGVVIHAVALGAISGQLPFHLNAHLHSSSLLQLNAAHRNAFPDAVEVSEVSVPVRTLDEELYGAELPKPSLLKLDVQGYERAVLNGGGATLASTEWVILELSFRPMYEGETSFLDMLGYMSARGFIFVRPVGWLASASTGEIVQCDALFARTASAPS